MQVSELITTNRYLSKTSLSNRRTKETWIIYGTPLLTIIHLCDDKLFVISIDEIFD